MCGEEWGAEGWKSSNSYRAIQCKKGLHQEAVPICCMTLGKSLNISGPQLLPPQNEVFGYIISGVLSSAEILAWISSVTSSECSYMLQGNM